MKVRSFPILFAVVAVFSMIVGPQVVRGQDTSQEVDRTIELVGTEYKFKPSDIEVRTEQRVKIVFKNEGTIAHDFHIKELDFKTDPIQPGNSTTYTFTTPKKPSTLTFACKVAGHEPAGMSGKITVQEGDQTSGNGEGSANNNEKDPSGEQAGKSKQGSQEKSKKTPGQQADQSIAERMQKRREQPLKEGWGAVKGQVILQGEQPDPYKNRGADVFEKQCNLKGAFSIQHVQVHNETGGVRDTLVYVKEVEAAHDDLLPSSTSTIVQENCRFHPSIQVVRTGGSIKLINNDPSVHNFKYDGLGSSNFVTGNLTQRGASGKTVVDKIKVKTPGVYSSVCNVHPWMNGLFLAVDHHAYDVSGKQGQFHLQLPPGTHTLRIRHYTQKEAKTVDVTISKGETVTKNIKLRLSN